MVAILAVLALIAVVVAPALTGLGGARHSAAAARLLRDVQFARQRAVASGQCTWVVVDASADRYALFIENPAAPGRERREPMIDDASGQEFVVLLNRGTWRGATIESAELGGGGEIGFDSHGRPLDVTGRLLPNDARIRLSGNQAVHIAARTGVINRVQ